MYCAVCRHRVTWSEPAQAWFHRGASVGTIAREVTRNPVSKPLRPVQPTPTSGTTGFTVPGTSRKVTISD